MIVLSHHFRVEGHPVLDEPLILVDQEGEVCSEERKDERDHQIVVWIKELGDEDVQRGKVARRDGLADTDCPRRQDLPEEDHGEITRIPDIQNLHCIPALPALHTRTRSVSRLEMLSIDESPYYGRREVVPVSMHSHVRKSRGDRGKVN